jgi:hypothetical protein
MRTAAWLRSEEGSLAPEARRIGSLQTRLVFALDSTEEDQAFTRALRSEPFGPWPRVRELLLEADLDPRSVEVHKVYEGWYGFPPNGELFELLSLGRVVFRARITHHGTETWTISEWRSATESS